MVGAILTALVTAICGKGQAKATVQSAKIQADATMDSAKRQAETTLQAVHAQIQEEQQSRVQLSRQDLSQKLAVLSSKLVRPIERLMSRFVPLCTLDTLRCLGFAPTKAFSQKNIEMYDQMYERYKEPLDFSGKHSGENSRCTFIVYLFRCLGAIGNWRDKVIEIVPVTDKLVSSGVSQLRRMEVMLSAPYIPGEPRFSRDQLDMIEDVFTSITGTNYWDAAIQSIQTYSQVAYAAKNVDSHFLGMFDQNADFILLRARQTRGGLLAILLMDLVRLLLPTYQFPFLDKRNAIWKTVIRDLATRQQQRLSSGQEINWYLYSKGDVLREENCPDPPRGEDELSSIGP